MPIDTDTYLASVRKQFEYYKGLAERAMAQVAETDLFWQPDANSNSIAVTVNHLAGNMRSRWTNFLTADGEKPWRNRDQEFEDIIKTREELLLTWESGWQRLFEALDSISEEHIDTPVYIRNQEHAIVEAINRQFAHYSYHIGQIVYLARLRAGRQWESLTIPKGGSASFNEAKFNKGKHRGHFTDDIPDNAQ